MALLLAAIQTLALGLLTALVLHQQRTVLLDLRASRIAVWTGDIESAAHTGHHNGLALAEIKALAPLLERLPQALPEVRAAEVYGLEGETGRVLFALNGQRLGGTIEARWTSLAAQNQALWRSLSEDGLLYVGRQLRDEREQRVGGYIIVADGTPVRQQINEAGTAFLPLAFSTITLSALFTLWVLVRGPLRAQPPAGSRLALRGRIVLFAFVLVSLAGAGLVWHATRLFSADLQPAVDSKAQAVAEFLQYKLQRAVALGVPFERLRGVDAYFTETRAQHPELLGLRLYAPEGTVLAQAGTAGATDTGIWRKLDLPQTQGAAIATFGDPAHVARSMKAILADLGIVLLAALLIFNEALRALLARPLPAQAGPVPDTASALAAIRLPLFLLILTEELTRSFLPLHIRGLAVETATGTLLGSATATGLPMSVYMVFFAVATPLGGLLADRWGPGRAFAAGALFTALGFMWAALTEGYWQFTASRALCATGYALATMACQRTILTHTDRDTRAQGLALLIGAVGIAAICGSSIGGVIADRLGAQPVFALSALLGLLGWAVFRMLCGQEAPRGSGAAPSEGPVPTFALADLGRLLAQPRFAALMLAGAIPAKIALAGFLFYLAPLALAHAGFSPAAIGRAVMLYFILISVLNPLASRLSDRLGWRWSPVLAGGAMIAVGGLAGLAMPAIGTENAVLCGILALGLGTGLSAASLQALASELGSAQNRIPAVAKIAAFRTLERLGSAIGPVLAGALVGGLAYGGAMTGIGFLVMTATLLLAVVAWRVGRAEQPR